MKLSFSADGAFLEDKGVLVDLDELYEGKDRKERRSQIKEYICETKGIRNE